jgi:glutamate synthase (NADPH) small chain
MGKPTGFVEWTRLLPKKRPVAERVQDFREVEGHEGGPLEADATRTQAGRCMDCGVPFCMQGCPLGNPIPDFAELVYRDRWRDAYTRLAATNDFPEFTGRLCPAPCEGACVLGIDGAPVTIESIEKAIAERAFAEGWVVAQPPRTRTGKRVAVVGSGPAGLAAANQLDRAGHTVIVYEAAAKPGGLLRYGIPDFKLEKAVLDRRLALLAAQGIEFRCGVTVGRDPTWAALRASHDAVIIAIGAQRPRELQIPGRVLPGVVLAMDFLVEQNEQVGGERAALQYAVRGKRVVILGGGDTGSDCLGTAHRQGAAHVTQIELLPAPPDHRAPANPWPEWPMIFRTSSSQEEGGERAFAFRTTRLSGNGKLEALHGVRVDDPEQREIELPVDTLVLALGFSGPEPAVVEQLGVALDDRGNIAVDRSFATSVPGVYCAGDADRGASLVVSAPGRSIRRCAEACRTSRRSARTCRSAEDPPRLTLLCVVRRKRCHEPVQPVFEQPVCPRPCSHGSPLRHPEGHRHPDDHLRQHRGGRCPDRAGDAPGSDAQGQRGLAGVPEDLDDHVADRDPARAAPAVRGHHAREVQGQRAQARARLRRARVHQHDRERDRDGEGAHADDGACVRRGARRRRHEGRGRLWRRDRRRARHRVVDRHRGAHPAQDGEGRLHQLAGLEERAVELLGTTRSVYCTGAGPAVIVMHESPGLYPEVIDFGRIVAEAGFRVYMPSLAGTPGKPMSPLYALQTIAHACVSREFTVWATGKTSPITDWLRALARLAHIECGGRGVGAIGMCLTGGFALAMMVDDVVTAPVLSQPSLPFGITRAQKRDLGIDDATLAKIRARTEVCVMGLRFTGDRMVPHERFERLRAELGDRFLAVEIDSSANNPHAIPRTAHSVLTYHRVDRPDHPTHLALQRVLAFLRERV